MASRENCRVHRQGHPTINQKEGDLQQLIAQTTNLLSPAGYSEKSIGDYTRSGFSRLMRYFDLHETHLYDENLLNNFVNETRAAYRDGMPMSVLSEFMGHADVETTKIYAYADTEMKRDAIRKGERMRGIMPDVEPVWKNDEEMMRKLCGLC